MRYLFLMLLQLTLISFASGQTAVDELKKLNEASAASGNFIYEMKYNFYVDNLPEPVETMEGASERNGNNFYYKIGPVEQIQDEKISLTVNTEEKYVICDKVENYAEQQMNMGISQILEEVKKTGKRLESETKPDGSRHLRIFRPEETTPSWLIIYDDKYEVRKLTLYFGAAETEALYGEAFSTSRLEIDLTKVQVSIAKKVGDIIRRQGQNVVLLDSYKQFSFYNQGDNK